MSFKRGRLDSGWLYIFGHYSVIFDRLVLIFGYVGCFWLAVRFFSYFFLLQGVRNVILDSLEDIEEMDYFQVS